MKKIFSYIFFTSLLCVACSEDATLEDSRVPEQTQPAISLEQVTVQKYDASFVVNVSELGTPKAVETGILVSTQSEPVLANSEVIVLDSVQPITKVTITFLPSTTYYARAYAITSNNIFYSDIKSFTTDVHPLTEYVGKKVLTTYEYNVEDNIAVDVTFSLDPEDESVLYLSGLNSYAGVDLALGNIKIIIDKKNGTATIPAGQLIEESKYGNYQYTGVDPTTGKYLLEEDIIGTCKDGEIFIDYLVALITEGNNAGLPHFLMEGIQIGKASKSAGAKDGHHLLLTTKVN